MDVNEFFGFEKYSGIVDTLHKLDPTSVIWGNLHRDTLMKHIAYQLHERMFFIGKDDYIMANLLYVFMQAMVHRRDYIYVTDAGFLINQYYNQKYFTRKVFDIIKYSIAQLQLTKRAT
jgi:hypothetical protein